MIDNREKYKDVKWVQGLLLNTKDNRKWSQGVRDTASYTERSRAYINFDPDSATTSPTHNLMNRTLVYHYANPEECALYVNEHNKNLELMQHTEAYPEHVPGSDKVWVNI